MNITLTKEERKEATRVLKEAMRILGTKENKYEINISTHMLYNYIRDVDILRGFANIREQTRSGFQYQSSWKANSYEQGCEISKYLSKFYKILGVERSEELIKYLSSKI